MNEPDKFALLCVLAVALLYLAGCTHVCWSASCNHPELSKDTYKGVACVMDGRC